VRDEATGYSFAKVLSVKSDANKNIIEIITILEHQTGRRLKTLRSDNGGEFTNKALEDFLVSKGIQAEKSLPYHHYQNGMIERYNRTIQDMGRMILIDSALPKSFWSYAFLWVNHVLNRIQNKASGDVTPYEGMYHIKPSYNCFRVFGAVGYIHIPEEKCLRL
jgi:transposase InsO family protein